MKETKSKKNIFDTEISADNLGRNSYEKDNYILSLETTIELLKRDLAKIKTETELLSDLSNNQKKDINQIYFELIEKLNNENNISTVYDLINDFLYKYFEFYEYNFYTLRENIIKPVFFIEESNLEEKVDSMIEQGIIDWIFDNKEIRIIPDLFDEQSNKATFLAVIPIIIFGEQVGFLVARTDKQLNHYNSKEITILKNLTLYFTLRLINENHLEEIEKLKSEIFLFSQEILDISNNSFFSELSSLFINELLLPLKKLDGHIKILKRGVGNLERRTELIEEESENIKNLIGQFNNIIKDLKRKKTRNLDLNEVIAEVILLIRGQLLQQDIEIEFSPYPNNLFVNIDKFQLEQIILIVIKFAKLKLKDGGKLQIITNNIGRYFNHITIIDNGIGYSPEDVKLLFEPEFNSFNTEEISDNKNEIRKTNKRKTYLNLHSEESLFVAKSILDNYKGKIFVVSELGIGTTYKIQIPKQKSKR